MSLTKELLCAAVARSRGIYFEALDDELSAGEKKMRLLREVWAHLQKGDDQ